MEPAFVASTDIPRAPPTSAADVTHAGIAQALVEQLGSDRSRLLDVVQALQRRFGYVSDDAVEGIASALHMHPVEIEDMVSFYAFLDRVPRGRSRIRLSKTPVSIMKGAEAVARAFEQALGLQIGGTSTDGEFTLEWTSDIGMADQEPAALVNQTVLTEITPDDVPEIVAALRKAQRLFETDPSHPDAKLGLLPKATIRSSLLRSGPLTTGPLGDAAGLRAAVSRRPEKVIEEITLSRLRGRGGAGFPTGMKWRLCRQAIGADHYVVCNADEGEPGTFKDRVLLSEFADLMFDGMTIAGYALGARHGLVYLRGEYAYLLEALEATLEKRRGSGFLGAAILGQVGFDFDIRIQLGAGAYICGEESSLIESLEGKRGAPRDRPPFPTERGYLRQPTAVDNVETFACVARIMEHGAGWFAAMGTRESAGTKLMSVSGDCERPGVYDVPFGITVNELLDLAGGADAELVQVGGPSGLSVAPKDFGRRIAYEDLSTGGSTMIFGPQRDVLKVALQFTEFFVDESCGWCTPCRVGTTLLRRGLDKVIAGRASLEDVEAIEALANTVMRMSRCGLGQTAPNPILSTMRSFPHLYEAKLRSDPSMSGFSMDDALGEAVLVQGRAPVTEQARDG